MTTLKVLAVTSSHLKAQLEKDPLSHSSIRVLARSSSSWAVGLRGSVLYCGPEVIRSSLPHHLYTTIVFFKEWNPRKQWKESSKIWSTVFCSLIMEVMSHHFYMFSYKQVVSSAHTQGGLLHRSVNTRRWRSLRTIIKSFLLHTTL